MAVTRYTKLSPAQRKARRSKYKAYRRAYNADPEKKRLKRNRQMIRTYNMTVEDYEAMVESQKGVCLICHRDRKLVIDHCHESGEVRGLLCGACNLMLGLLRDDPQILRRALRYLEK
jgi:hypothetical protein